MKRRPYSAPFTESTSLDIPREGMDESKATVYDCDYTVEFDMFGTTRDGQEPDRFGGDYKITRVIHFPDAENLDRTKNVEFSTLCAGDKARIEAAIRHYIDTQNEALEKQHESQNPNERDDY